MVSDSSLTGVQRLQLCALREIFQTPAAVSTIRQRQDACRTLRIDEERLDLLLGVWCAPSHAEKAQTRRIYWTAANKCLREMHHGGPMASSRMAAICDDTYQSVRAELVRRGLISCSRAMVEITGPGRARVAAKIARPSESVMATILVYRRMLRWILEMETTTGDRWIRPTMASTAEGPFTRNCPQGLKSRRRLLRAMESTGLHTRGPSGTLYLSDEGRDYLTWDLSKRG